LPVVVKEEGSYETAAARQLSKAGWAKDVRPSVVVGCFC
jgi:hypothetical protein